MRLPAGHHWAEFVRTADPFWWGVRSCLVAFMAIGPDFTPQFIGTGFVVGSSPEGYLLVMSAKHVVEGAAMRVQRPTNRRALSAPSILFEPERPKIGAKEMRAVWMGADCADVLLVRQITLFDNMDICQCVLEAQHSLKDQIHRLTPAVAIDRKLPDVGSAIHIVALAGFSLTGDSPAGDGSGHWQIETRPVIRVGTVTGHQEQGLMHKGPCFVTSVPTDPGMSGGFAYVPRDGEAVAACGVVSSSPSGEEGCSDFRVSGHSVIVSLTGAQVGPERVK